MLEKVKDSPGIVSAIIRCNKPNTDFIVTAAEIFLDENFSIDWDVKNYKIGITIRIKL